MDTKFVVLSRSRKRRRCGNFVWVRMSFNRLVNHREYCVRVEEVAVVGGGEEGRGGIWLNVRCCVRHVCEQTHTKTQARQIVINFLNLQTQSYKNK